MKNFIIAFLVLLFCQNLVNADTRYYTTGTGIVTPAGYIKTLPYGVATSCDPFFFSVDGEKYYMLFDNGNVITHKSLLGCDGSRKSGINEPLLKLNIDSDKSKLTADELRSAGIRFVKLNRDGRLGINNKNTDFDLDKVEYIDLKHLRYSLTITPMGNYDIYIKKDRSKSLKKVVGYTKAHYRREVERLFNY